VHRQYFEPNTVQISTLLSIKTGGCPEDCSYCSQSVRFNTGVPATPLLSTEEVLEKARTARASGATRFCMGAAYRSPKPKQLAQIIELIGAVRSLGMETCATLGMLNCEQAQQLKAAGLDYYNHNLDASAAAAFWAWVRANSTAHNCCTPWRRCQNIRTAFPSTS